MLALVGRSVWLCVALHSGLNLASVLQGAPPVRLAPAPAVGAAAGCVLLLSALYLQLDLSRRSGGLSEPAKQL